MAKSNITPNTIATSQETGLGYDIHIWGRKDFMLILNVYGGGITLWDVMSDSYAARIKKLNNPSPLSHTPDLPVYGIEVLETGTMTTENAADYAHKILEAVTIANEFTDIVANYVPEK